MDAAVAVQVDLLRSFRGGTDRAFEQRFARTRDCDHRAVMVGIAGAMEDERSGNRSEGVFERVDYGDIAPLRKVGDAFNETFVQAAPAFQRPLLKITTPSRIATAT